MTRILPFVAHWRGQVCNFPGGAGECVDLANQYLQDVWRASPRRLNAADWAGIALPGMAWEPNSPVNSPPAGSLVVWGAYHKELIGDDGHIAIAVSAEVMQVLSFDQNWPEGAVCSLVIHDYGGILGWHRPAG